MRRAAEPAPLNLEAVRARAHLRHEGRSGGSWEPFGCRNTKTGATKTRKREIRMCAHLFRAFVFSWPALLQCFVAISCFCAETTCRKFPGGSCRLRTPCPPSAIETRNQKPRQLESTKLEWVLVLLFVFTCFRGLFFAVFFVAISYFCAKQ